MRNPAGPALLPLLFAVLIGAVGCGSPTSTPTEGSTSVPKAKAADAATDSKVDSLSAEQADQTDRRKLQGAWVVVSAQRDGKKAPDLVGHKLSVQADRFAIAAVDGKTLYGGVFRLEPARMTKEIDFVHDVGDAKGKTWLGIYSLEGNKLLVCDNAGPRPTAFNSPKDSTFVNLVFERKPEAPTAP